MTSTGTAAWSSACAADMGTASRQPPASRARGRLGGSASVMVGGEVTMSVLLASSGAPVVDFARIDLSRDRANPLPAWKGVIINRISSGVGFSLLALSRARTTRAVQ